MKFIYLSFLITLMSFSGMAQEVQRIFIKEHKASCTGVAPMECLVVKYENDPNWTYFYSHIEGFTYEPGYRYELVVNLIQRDLKDLPADSSSIRYELQRIVSKTLYNPLTESVLDYIADNNWKLMAFNGESDLNFNQSLRLDFQGLRVFGQAGCNGFSGNIALNTKQGVLAFSDLLRTELACENLELETKFLKTLENNVFHFDVADQTLNLYQGSKLIMIFGKTLEK